MDSSRDQPLADAEKATREIPAYIRAVTQQIPLTEIDSVFAAKIYRENRDTRLYKNEFVIHLKEEEVFLIAESPRSLLEDSPVSLVWFWNNHLWPMYTLTMYWRSVGVGGPISFRAFFKIDSTELEYFRTKPTQVILLRGQQCVSACVLDLQNVDPAMWEVFDQQTPHEAVCDELAAKAWIESHLNRPEERTAVQELESTWARRLEIEIATAFRFFRDRQHEEVLQQETERVHASLFGEYFKDTDSPAASIYNSFQDAYGNSEFNALKMVTLPRTELAQAPYHHDFVSTIMQCAWFSGLRTSCGKRIYSISLKETTKPVLLNTQLLGDQVKSFWERIAFDWPFYFDEIIGGGSCPIDIAKLVKGVPVYEGEITKGEQFIKDLFAEATSMKQWTIPFGAYVQLDVRDFQAIKLYEIGRDIACIFVNQEGNYYQAWVNPSEQTVTLTNEIKIAEASGLAGKSMDWVARFKLGSSILLAAIIRDFWVVEERETTFGVSRAPKTGTPILGADKGKPVVVYLPRIRYVADIKHTGDELDLVKRRPHFVVGHLRRVLNASEEQIQLARRYGITVPEGFTFVRPHKRGDMAVERIYRSRSALNCIRALDLPSLDKQRDAWFTYELNVKKWLAANGYEVEHLAASKNGDGGVDIQAFKGDEHLLVQCKYRRKTKIGPAVVREMMGVLQTFPEGAKGVIVTSSELTEGSKNLALENGIQFIENVDFTKQIKN